MSEDFHQLPGEAGEPGEPGQAQSESGLAAEVARDQQPTPEAPGVQRAQPLSESIIPEQPAGQPQYPPPPEYYAQMPVTHAYGVPPVGAGSPPLTPGAPMFPPPVVGGPNFPPPAMGGPAFPPPAYGYGYGYPPMPQAQPLPLGQAIRELPRQYKKILFKPGVRSFAEEQGKADWGIIWMQLLFLMVVQALVSVPFYMAYNQALASALSVSGPAGESAIFASPTILVVEVIVQIILVPLAFLIGVGVQYLVAKAFKGFGNFKQQAYNQLLFQAPLGIVSALMLLLLTPTIGNTLTTSLTSAASGYTTSTPMMSGPFLLVGMLLDLVSLAVSVYTVILNVFSIMAVHRMSGGKATASVLIPYGILIVVAFVFICAIVAIGVLTIQGSLSR